MYFLDVQQDKIFQAQKKIKIYYLKLLRYNNWQTKVLGGLTGSKLS